MIRFLFALPLVFSLMACQGQSPTESAAANQENVSTYQDIELSVFESMRQAADENTIILDVRTPAETGRGIIPGAMVIDYRAADFSQQIAALNRNKTYLVYCASGGRSARAGKQLEALGVKSVCNLLGGYSAWSAAQ